MSKFKPTKCVICDSEKQTIWWVIEKFFLRLTEISFLWENCCSGKCYEALLVGLLNDTYSIEVVNGVTVLKRLKG